MTENVPVAVVIPTWARGDLVLRTLERILECSPRPNEIWVHVDQTDGKIERILAKKFPQVQVISSPTRLGPGGGRDACLRRCKSPLAVSFDDDSWPFDCDFFARVLALFKEHPEAAVIGAVIWHRHEGELARTTSFQRKVSFTGCGCAIRTSAYRRIAGYVPRPFAYGLEESDVSLQLFAAGQRIYESGELRVFHDTELRHHAMPEIVESVVANAALLAFLRYPTWLWPVGAYQLLSMMFFCMRVRRFRGLISGLFRIPGDCWAFRFHRRVLPASAIIGFLRFKRAGYVLRS